MAQYDSLKDYIRLNHWDTIVEGVNDYIRTSSNVKLRINDLKILTQGKIVFMPSDIMVQSEITFSPFDILTFVLGISCEESDEDNNSVGVYYYNVMLRGNMSKRFSDLCVLAVEECTQESLISETVTGMFGLPDIAVDNLEEEADRVHKSLYTSVKRNEEHRYRFEPVLIKEKYKKRDNMHMWPAELPEECLGQIRFEASSATIYDINDPCTPHPNYPIPANSILLNVKYYRNEIGCDDIITATHELVHWEIHRDYMRLLQFLDDRYKVMECKTVPIPLDNNMSPKEKARWYAEWQANELAIRVAMPKHLVEEALTEFEQCNNDSRHNGDYYENTICKLAWDFNVPKEVMKIRLRQLGYDYADGTFVTVDDCFYPPFTFPRGTLREDETFVIDRDNYERLLLDNEEFAELIGKRYFVYTGYVVCYNNPKYIKHKFSHGVTEYVLSDYAREHVDECCYKFKYTYTSNNNSFTEYTTSQYLCKLDDIILTITTDADNKGVSINAKQLKKIFDKLKEDEKKAKITNAKMILANITTFSAIFKYHKEQIEGLTNEKIEDTYGIPVDTLKAYVAPENSRRYRKPSLENMMLLCHAFHLPHDTAIDFLVKAKTPLDKNNALHMLYDDLLRITDEPIDIWNKYLTENGEKKLTVDTEETDEK